MPKITFMGAGSTVFAKNVLGDCMTRPSLQDSHIALYDIDGKRLRESKMMLENLNQNINRGRAKITGHVGVKARKTALKGANYVVNAIQVGGYRPSTVIDFEIPKKYGLRQTIADTLGIGGIFRGLRTIPVMLDFVREMEEVCPEAWLLNYTNPMSILTGAMLQGTSVKTVGLCHSVQVCARALFNAAKMHITAYPNLKWKTSGINHMGWLIELKDGNRDLYPEVKKAAFKRLDAARKKGGEKFGDMVRLEMMRNFGYYVTESSEHSAEYYPYWIKSQYPELIEEYKIPLDEYPRRCVHQIEQWEARSKEMVQDKKLDHKQTHEYGSLIMQAIETDVPERIGGNVINNGFIPNLPDNAVVEVPCMVDRNGVQGCHVGRLPEQLAALCRTHINVHLLTIEAALMKKKDRIYQAAMVDPHTSTELTLDKIRALVDDLIEAHGDYLPKYK
ncbi:alpha-glucosidase/alpha-galactosidase [bacterium]|nr:alpha-glucosidase/alpha-galactosidase [bacterium]